MGASFASDPQAGMMRSVGSKGWLKFNSVQKKNASPHFYLGFRRAAAKQGVLRYLLKEN